MRESQKASKSGRFAEILVNQNNKIEYSDYKVRNWSMNDIDSKKCNDIMALLCDSECEKLNRIGSSIICYFQNSNNSLIEIILRQIDGEKLSQPLEKNKLQYAKKSLYSGEIVRMFGNYYLIGYFIDDVNIDELFTVAVYRLDSLNNLEELYEYKTNNELFEKSFPEYLSYYMNSTKYICFWYLSMLIEATLIFYLANRGKTGDGSKPLKKSE